MLKQLQKMPLLGRRIYRGRDPKSWSFHALTGQWTTCTISATSVYPLLPSQVVSICDLQRLALYWFHAPGLQLDNEVSQSTASHMEPSSNCTTVTGPVGERAFKRAFKTHLFSTAGAIEVLLDSGAAYKHSDLLTYFPIYLKIGSVVFKVSCL